MVEACEGFEMCEQDLQTGSGSCGLQQADLVGVNMNFGDISNGRAV
jgi:hypothetical protein